MKQKTFQLALNDEIRLDAATSKRSQTTGHLLITMPKLSVDRANNDVLNEDNIGAKQPSEYMGFKLTCKQFQHVAQNMR